MGAVRVGKVELGSGRPKICVPLVAARAADILAAARSIRAARPDLVEWRVDHFDRAADRDAVRALARQLRDELADIPVIFTFRSKCEGGSGEITAAEYLQLYKAVIETGCVDALDVEIYSMKEIVPELTEYAQKHCLKVIFSNHDFERTPKPTEIMNRLEYMSRAGGNLLKVAFMPQDDLAVSTLMECGLKASRLYPDQPLIIIAMGRPGIISRIFPENFGSCLTFATVGEKSAPGQLSVAEIRDFFTRIHGNNVDKTEEIS